MPALTMFVTGLPELRTTPLTRDDAAALSDLVRDMELRYFGRSETNIPEILGTLNAPELHGTSGTAGIWDEDELVATMLAYDDLPHDHGVFVDLFINAHPRRREIAGRLLTAARGYAAALGAQPGNQWLKVETFAGDVQTAAVVAADGYRQHRVYLRMRIDFDQALPLPAAPEGLVLANMTEQRWPEVHAVLTAAFRDHYDSHAVPLAEFKRRFDRDSTDLSMWRLVYDGDRLVGVRVSSTRYAPHGLGYVDSLGVLREYRGRGIATYLLLEAFHADRAAGLTGTSLHCDATNLTGATRLYQAVGMRPDQHYDAWRARS